MLFMRSSYSNLGRGFLLSWKGLIVPSLNGIQNLTLCIKQAWGAKISSVKKKNQFQTVLSDSILNPNNRTT